jgi:hypothetical protein
MGLPWRFQKLARLQAHWRLRRQAGFANPGNGQARARMLAAWRGFPLPGSGGVARKPQK